MCLKELKLYNNNVFKKWSRFWKKNATPRVSSSFSIALTKVNHSFNFKSALTNVRFHTAVYCFYWAFYKHSKWSRFLSHICFSTWRSWAWATRSTEDKCVIGTKFPRDSPKKPKAAWFFARNLISISNRNWKELLFIFSALRLLWKVCIPNCFALNLIAFA